MRRQGTYLLMRHLLLTNADALADIVERVVRRDRGGAGGAPDGDESTHAHASVIETQV